MTSPPTVLTFGEALVGYASVEDNLRAATQFTRFPGGADLNVAVGLTRLGVRTIWASVLGEDAHADYMADAVDQLGVTSLVRRASGPTALMFKAGGATGDPEVLQVTVTPVDTVGAGDGFAAGHLAAFLVGDSMQERVDQGAAVGALVTTRRGDLAAMPQREEVDALINSTPTRQVPATRRHG
jgi:sugar/nucleoside kinase (ribokinase family)